MSLCPRKAGKVSRWLWTASARTPRRARRGHTASTHTCARRRVFFELAGPQLVLSARTPLVLAAGAWATVITCFVITPFEAIRIRMVEDPTYSPSFVGALNRFVDEGGWLVLYDGLLPLLVRQVQTHACQQARPHGCTRSLTHLLTLPLTQSLTHAHTRAGSHARARRMHAHMHTHDARCCSAWSSSSSLTPYALLCSLLP